MRRIDRNVCGQPRDRYVSRKARCWLFLIHKSCFGSEYIILVFRLQTQRVCMNHLNTLRTGDADLRF